MTRLERIAEVMGWDETIDLWSPIDIGIAKLLQQHMVDDGWNIQIQHFKVIYGKYAGETIENNGFQVFARRDPVKFRNEYEYITKSCIATEPAAIFELFCAMYSIKEDKE